MFANMIVHVLATDMMYIEMPNMVVFVVKRHAVLKAKKWRYAVHKAKIGR